MELFVVYNWIYLPQSNYFLRKDVWEIQVRFNKLLLLEMIMFGCPLNRKFLALTESQHSWTGLKAMACFKTHNSVSCLPFGTDFLTDMKGSLWTAEISIIYLHLVAWVSELCAETHAGNYKCILCLYMHNYILHIFMQNLEYHTELWHGLPSSLFLLCRNLIQQNCSPWLVLCATLAWRIIVKVLYGSLQPEAIDQKNHFSFIDHFISCF